MFYRLCYLVILVYNIYKRSPKIKMRISRLYVDKTNKITEKKVILWAKEFIVRPKYFFILECK